MYFLAPGSLILNPGFAQTLGICLCVLAFTPTLFLICTSASPMVISHHLMYGAPLPRPQSPECPALTLVVPKQDLALLPVEMGKSIVADHC